MKLKLKERRFKTIQEIETKSQRVLYTLQLKDFKGAFEAWQKRWRHCIKSQGDYFEGDGGMVLGSWDKHVNHESLSEVSDDGTFIFGKPPEISEIEGNLKILNGNMGQPGYR
ncbi:mariner mos1 transposase [Lasius niger]|uniref:Mariner mos1 transposase n=1 Tax=Lasius niger TaxID=67767 RepID=A0A0J7KBN7_LASNI|nr:mariner mos1 transposase [Lasius niger]